MSRKIAFIAFFWLIAFSGFSATVNKSLFIVADSLLAVDGVKMPYITFNESAIFTQKNPIIELGVGDTLNVWVFNHDSVQHEFSIKNISGVYSIAASDSVFVQQAFTSAGCYTYYDPLQYPTFSYLGLTGIIVVKSHNHASFYWNIREHNTDWNNQLANGGVVNWNQYDPKYFTINGVSHPDISQDPLARITGQVGDTIYLYMANVGQGVHSIHFHGYHAVIEFSSKNATHVGREKDTFPIYPLETMVLKIVPDKPGEYPVHAHNLVAVTGNNIYPNGMFSTILITP